MRTPAQGSLFDVIESGEKDVAGEASKAFGQGRREFPDPAPRHWGHHLFDTRTVESRLGRLITLAKLQAALWQSLCGHMRRRPLEVEAESPARAFAHSVYLVLGIFGLTGEVRPPSLVLLATYSITAISITLASRNPARRRKIIRLLRRPTAPGLVRGVLLCVSICAAWVRHC